MLEKFGVDAWVFTTANWLVRDPNGDYVMRERKTILAEPTVVADFDGYLAQAAKIVGSSTNFALLAECESKMRKAVDGQASIARSQPYYLDVTPPALDKGTFVDTLARRLGISHSAIAVLGDMENDLAVFRKAGLSIAMGNAALEVKRQANYVTASNAQDGFAKAIERYILNEPKT
jgi:hydroxymethylpyrimidine pyrophosphatase-like HAD family hydrolase